MSFSKKIMVSGSRLKQQKVIWTGLHISTAGKCRELNHGEA